MWAAELRGRGCADSLNAALAHSPLRNCQRRGFPRGGHSIQPLHTPGAAAAAPPPPHKMAAPIEEIAAASSAPFCGRREICQHGIPRLRMHPSLEILLKGWSRGDLIQRKTAATITSTPFFFFLLFSFSRRKRQKLPGAKLHFSAGYASITKFHAWVLCRTRLLLLMCGLPRYSFWSCRNFSATAVSLSMPLSATIARSEGSWFPPITCIPCESLF
uniref:uncharacterized protein LOC118553022 isoform X2 n=1 Tax=Halichoerus grypus TaxID=9711 RepID=UPI00165A03B5|nr:uncharacterized protein LOC118553022 isoform X2 [Halichoerus grypus]